MAKKVLLCDDEVHILRAAEFKLSRAGYQVRTAFDGEEAWQAIQTERPDILVTDLQMPRLTGIGLTQRIREHSATRDLPVVMLTAKGYELGECGVSDELGLVALLTKPFSPRELLAVVERTLAAAGTPEPAPGGRQRVNLPTEIFGDTIVAHTPEELGTEQAEELPGYLAGLERRNIVLDLDHTEFLGSAGLTSLLDAQDRLRDLGGDVKISTGNATNRKILEVTRLDQQLEVYDSVIDAVKSFQ